MLILDSSIADGLWMSLVGGPGDFVRRPPALKSLVRTGLTDLKTMKARTFFARTTCPEAFATRFATACVARLLAPLLLLALSIGVQAQYRYTTNNGAINITKYYGWDGAVTIPDTINGLPVTTIEGGAFDDCSTVTNVTIPGSVTNIAYRALLGCDNLAAITVDALNSF